MQRAIFKPNFQYTNRIVNCLSRIAAAREVILNSPLIPRWEVSLRKEALIRSAHSSTSIEGNRLNISQVSDLAMGRDIMAFRKDKQEVLNYLKVLENLGHLTSKSDIAERNILEIHRMLMVDTLDNPPDCGSYRNRYVVVANRMTGDVIFRPPPNDEVPQLVRNLLAWINAEEAPELDPVIGAGIAHYELVRIHPFIDGNGRIARVLAALLLFLRGFDTKQFFCLDDYYDSDRPAYYRALQTVDPGTQELTAWLTYFVEGVMVSMNAVKERVVRLSSERLKASAKGQVALSERQMKIVEYLNRNPFITVGDMVKMFQITRQAALKEIGKLVDLEVVRLVGQKRGARYILT
jgi:Fic family protein